MRIVSTLNFIPDRSRPGLTTTAIGAVDLQGAGGNWATVGGRSRGGRRVRRQREKRKGKSVGLRIGTLNVGTMTGKGRELADMMERRKVDILCVQETRWKGSKARSIGAGFKLFYYGVDSKRNGVGVVLKEEFVRNVLEVKRVSDRVMSLKLEIEGVMLNVVSGYAPQVGCELEEKERFWSELDEVMESIPTGERVVIGADFNGHVGEGNTGDEEVMGKFGVKERNLEDLLMKIILCRRGNLKEISDCKVVVGESVARQHRMVVCRMTLMVCKKKRSEIEKKTKWWKLKKEECCEEFRQKLRQALGGQVVLPDDWETTAEVIRETGRKVLGVSSGRRKEDKETWWWNEEVQDSVQRKRLAKKKWDMDRTEENRQEYKELQRRVKREVSKAKQKAYDELYTRLDTREGEKDLYRLARQRDRDGKDVQQVRVIKDRDGRVLTSEESVQRRWKEYFEELMNEENEREKRVEGVNSVEQKVDKIRKDEVRKALKRMKSGKAIGPDDIPVEVWKCLGEAAVEFLTSLFNRVLESERMPEEWRRSVLVPIFKNKGDVQSCSNYRGIKLMSHTMKLWERVVEARLRKVVEICEQQYGFMPRKSRTDAIFALRILMEKYRDGQRELHCVFVDLEKAYDRVPREELWYCMRKSGVAEKYVRVVQDMYERSRTVVRCAVGQTEEFKVEVGLHQGSALSPFLFAIVMDQLSEEVRQESPWTMMFADDIVICSESREQVEENLERWRFALERRGMKVSGSKTEYMCVNEREGSGTVRLQGEEVKKVQEFKYLGSTVQSNGECGKEVKKRVQAGWNGWRKVSGVLCERKISARIKGKVYRTVVRAAMLYGLETVSLRKRQESELEVAELKMLRLLCHGCFISQIMESSSQPSDAIEQVSDVEEKPVDPMEVFSRQLEDIINTYGSACSLLEEKISSLEKDEENLEEESTDANAVVSSDLETEPTASGLLEGLDKEASLLLQSLKALMSPEEKVEMVLRKYAELLKEQKNEQVQLKLLQKRQGLLVKQKDQLQLEHSRGILARSRLEILCQDLHEHNKTLKVSQLSPDLLKCPLEGKAQHLYSGLIKMNRETAVGPVGELAKKLTSILQQYEKREESLEKIFKQKDLQQQLSDAKLEEANLRLKDAEEKHKREKEYLLKEAIDKTKKCFTMKEQELQMKKQQLLTHAAESKLQVKELKEQNTVMQAQLVLYSQKFDEFQATLAKSNEVYSVFKQEMDKMTMKMKKLEKESNMWKIRFDSCNKALTEMIEERSEKGKELEMFTVKIDKLQMLCRALQEERKVLYEKIKDIRLQTTSASVPLTDITEDEIPELVISEPVRNPALTAEIEKLWKEQARLQEFAASLMVSTAEDMGSSDTEEESSEPQLAPLPPVPSKTIQLESNQQEEEPPKLEPAKVEPPKAEPLKAEPPKEEPPKEEPPKEEPPKAEPPKEEPPKAEPPKAEPPKVESPKEEPPKAEPPKAEPPKAEPPKEEPPKAEPPKAEPPKVESPKEEPPKAEPPKAEPPKAEPPKEEPPKAEPPKAESPKEEPPKAEPPKAEPPKAEPPKEEPPKAEPPKEEPPKVEPPKVEPPKAEPPEVEPPKAEEPKAEPSKAEEKLTKVPNKNENTHPNTKNHKEPKKPRPKEVKTVTAQAEAPQVNSSKHDLHPEPDPKAESTKEAPGAEVEPIKAEPEASTAGAAKPQNLKPPESKPGANKAHGKKPSNSKKKPAAKPAKRS
ncbi:hypothetical protein QTP86_030801 [Hemibagrus guttatus]|nr:hypothetical protein QTP86_030801 [Hemibagrus guttatus]